MPPEKPEPAGVEKITMFSNVHPLQLWDTKAPPLILRDISLTLQTAMSPTSPFLFEPPVMRYVSSPVRVMAMFFWNRIGFLSSSVVAS